MESNPVLGREPRDASEVFGVVGDECQPQRQRMSRYEGVERADRLTPPRQCGCDPGESIGRGLVEGYDIDGFYKRPECRCRACTQASGKRITQVPDALLTGGSGSTQAGSYGTNGIGSPHHNHDERAGVICPSRPGPTFAHDTEDGDNATTPSTRSSTTARCNAPSAPFETPTTTTREAPTSTSKSTPRTNSSTGISQIPLACPEPPNHRCASATAPKSAKLRALTTSTRPLDPARTSTPTRERSPSPPTKTPWTRFPGSLPDSTRSSLTARPRRQRPHHGLTIHSSRRVL